MAHIVFLDARKPQLARALRDRLATRHIQRRFSDRARAMCQVELIYVSTVKGANMSLQRILGMGLLVAVVSVVCSNDAQARWRGRNRCCGYGYSTTYNYTYGATNQCNTCAGNGQFVNQGAVMTNPTAPQPNIVNRPTYLDQTAPTGPIPADAPQPVAAEPAPAIANPPQVNNAPGNTLPSNPEAAQVPTNTSPNPDNEGRNASKIPGTAPTKAPAPAANANP